MTDQPTTTAARQCQQWPQYRKFSAAPTRTQIAARTALAVIVAAAVCLPWMLDERLQQGPGVRPTTFVKLDRVEIVGKRERPSSVAAHRPADAADPSLVKLVRDQR